jgi:hypothetical protein
MSSFPNYRIGQVPGHGRAPALNLSTRLINSSRILAILGIPLEHRAMYSNLNPYFFLPVLADFFLPVLGAGSSSEDAAFFSRLSGLAAVVSVAAAGASFSATC